MVTVGVPCRPRSVVLAHSAQSAAMHIHSSGATSTASVTSSPERTGGFASADDCFGKLLQNAYQKTTPGSTAATVSDLEEFPKHITFESTTSNASSTPFGPNKAKAAAPISQRSASRLLVHDVWLEGGEASSSGGRLGMNLGQTPDDMAHLLLDGVNVSVLQLRHTEKLNSPFPNPRSSSRGGLSPFVEDFKTHRQHGDALFRQLLSAVASRLLDREDLERCIIPSRDRLLTNFHATVSMIEFVNEEIVDLLVGAEKQRFAAFEDTATSSQAPLAPSASPESGDQSQAAAVVLSAAVSNDSISSGQGAIRWLSDDDERLDDTASSIGSTGITNGSIGAASPPHRHTSVAMLSPRLSGGLSRGSTSVSETAKASSEVARNVAKSSHRRSASSAERAAIISGCNTSSQPSTLQSSSAASSSSVLKLRSCGGGGLGIFVDGASSLSIADSTDLERVVECGLTRRDDMYLARGSCGAVSHTALLLRFQRGTLGESFVTDTELVLVDACIPMTAGSAGTNGGAGSPMAISGAGFDAYSVRKATQSATALCRLIESVASEPKKSKGQIRPTDSARTIRSAVKRESALTRLLSERLDGNVVLYTVTHLVSEVLPTSEAAGADGNLTARTIASLSRVKQIQDSFVNVVDPSRSTREVTVTSQAIQHDLRRLRQSLRELQDEQKSMGGDGLNAANRHLKKVVALKKQISAHEERLGELRQFLSKRKLSFSRLRVKCERQRSQLDALHSELAQKSNTADELRHVSLQLEESKKHHDVLVEKLQDEIHSLVATDNQLTHARTVASLLETDTQRSSLGKMTSEAELARQRSNYFRQVFVAATMQKKFLREEVPLRDAARRLSAGNQVLQAKLDIKNRSLLREAQAVIELEQQEKTIHSRIIQIMFAEEAYRVSKGPEDLEAAQTANNIDLVTSDVCVARQELGELELMIGIFTPEVLEAAKHRQALEFEVDRIAGHIFRLDCDYQQAQEDHHALVQTEANLRDREPGLNELILKLRSEWDLQCRIDDHLRAEIATIEAEVCQTHIAANQTRLEVAESKAELAAAAQTYRIVMAEYTSLCDQFSIRAPVTMSLQELGISA